MADAKISVLFHQDYTVKNDDGDFYKAGEVYEMTAAQAELFRVWADCEATDRRPTAKPVRTGKRPSNLPRRAVAPGPLTPAVRKLLDALMGPSDGFQTRNG